MLNLRKMYKEMHVNDRRILITSALLMLVFAYLVVDDRLLIFGSNSKSPIIGEIIRTRVDVRHKQSNNLNWETASESENLRVGDSLFTGRASNAKIKIQESSIEVSENSLISFKKVKGLNTSNLNFGDFSITVNGSLKLEVNGEMVELKGRNSKLRATLDANQKVTWRAVKGETTLVTALGSSRLNTLNPLETENVASIFPPAPHKNSAGPEYYWHAEEFYTTHQDKYRLRKELPAWISTPITLEWKDHNQVSNYTVQFSGDSQFNENIQMVDSQEKQYTFPRLKRGLNFWRVSRNGGAWSTVETIDFQPRLKPAGLQITSGSPTLQILSRSVDSILAWTQVSDAISYFVEASPDPNFPPEKTSVARTDQLTHAVRFHKPGTFYFRVRAMDQEQQMTIADGTAIKVFDIPLLGAPQVPKRDMIFKNAKRPVTLPWKGPRGAMAYDIEIRDLRDQKSFYQTTQASKLQFPELKNGPYTYQVTARDRFGRKSHPSAVKSFVVSVPEIILAQRDPAQTLTTTANEVPRLEFMNQKYPDSRLQVEGAGFTMYSSNQIQAKETAPLAATMGLRVLKWMESFGFEGFFKTKVFNYNPAAQKVNPLWVEGRAHKRWTLPFHWMDTFREIQISLFLGAEQYYNFASDQYSRQYSLMKVGTLIAFPVWRRWDTGGELVYGRGFDSSYKYEVSGYVNYYLKKQWTYGVGYRVHLFNAGSLDSAPKLPFREGYLEIYSALRYFY